MTTSAGDAEGPRAARPGAVAPGRGDRGAGAANGSTAGSIYDLGYRGYEGPRLGRRHAIGALFIQTLKVCYGIGRGGRAKLAPFILLGFATIPAIVAVGAFALARQQGFGEFVEEASPVQHNTLYALVSTLVVLFCAAQAPETLGRDQRHRLLPLYFSRALRRTDYALARFGGIVAAVLLFVLVPQAVTFFGLVLSAEDVGTELGREVAFLPGILGQGLLLSGVLGGIAALISAFTPRRVYATTAIIVVLAVTPVIVEILRELGATTLVRLLVLLSPGDILDATNAWLFGRTPESPSVFVSGLPLEAFAVAAVLIAAGCAAAVVRRYERIAA